jgi:flagellar motility protein MotE (MotC chaperone)
MSNRSVFLALALLCIPALFVRAQSEAPAEKPAAEAKAPAAPGAEGAELGAGGEPLPDATAPSGQPAGRAQARRALEVEAREAALRTLEADINAKLEELRQLQVAAQETLEPKRKREVEDVAKLVKFYQSMKPQSAANLLEALPLPLATSVLRAMKAREAAKILNVMEADRAVQISRLMAGK